METLQVQSAGAVAPTPPASTVFSGTPAEDDSFALTLGHALENKPNSDPDGSSITPKASLRGKATAGGNSDSPSMAGILFDCFVINILPPAPTVALSTKAPESALGLPSPESTSDSAPDFASSLNTSAGEMSPNPGTLSIPAAIGGVAAPGTLSASAGLDVEPTGTAKPEGSKSPARQGGPVAIQSNGLISVTLQNRPEDTTTLQSISAPAWFPGLQDNSLLRQPVEQPVGGALSESKQVQASDLGSAQESGPRQDSQASSRFADSWPQLEQLDPAQMQAAPQSPSNQDLRAASNPTLSAGQVGQASPAFVPEARDASTPVSAADHPELAEFSSRLGKFPGAEINVKVYGNESQQATAPEKFPTGTDRVAAGTLSSGLRNTGTIHSAQVSSKATTDEAWQKGNEPEAASERDPLSSSASPIASPQLDANWQPATPATTLQKDLEANGIQPSAAWSADSGESTARANPTDSSTSGQGKPGQQSGPDSGDNPTGVTTFVPGLANNPVADSTASLLTAQAPSLPASHASAAAPQTSLSSSQPPATLSAWQNYDGVAGKIVRSASLSDSAHGAEMHVELRTTALGPMDVRTVLHDGSVGAEIHVQGQEAHTLLAAGLPSLERALGERNLRVENIAVYQDHAGGGMSEGEKQDPHSGSSPSPQRQVLPWDNPPQRSSAARGSLEDEELANPAAGLSVRA